MLMIGSCRKLPYALWSASDNSGSDFPSMCKSPTPRKLTKPSGWMLIVWSYSGVIGNVISEHIAGPEQIARIALRQYGLS